MNEIKPTPGDIKGEDEVAAKINALHDELNELARTSVEKAIRIGGMLVEQKAKIGRGFRPWVKKNLSFGKSTAYKYLRIYEHRESVQQLDTSSVEEAYRLLSQPANPEPEPEEDEPEAWDCPHCDHTWPAHRDQCWNCYYDRFPDPEPEPELPVEEMIRVDVPESPVDKWKQKALPEDDPKAIEEAGRERDADRIIRLLQAVIFFGEPVVSRYMPIVDDLKKRARRKGVVLEADQVPEFIEQMKLILPKLAENE